MRWPNSVCLSDGAALLLLQVRQQAPVRIGREQEPVRAEAEARAQAAIPAAGASGSVRTPGAVKLTAGIATGAALLDSAILWHKGSFGV